MTQNEYRPPTCHTILLLTMTWIYGILFICIIRTVLAMFILIFATAALACRASIGKPGKGDTSMVPLLSRQNIAKVSTGSLLWLSTGNTYKFIGSNHVIWRMHSIQIEWSLDCEKSRCFPICCCHSENLRVLCAAPHFLHCKSSRRLTKPVIPYY